MEHTPALLYATFSDIRPIMVDGVEVGAYTMDVDRVKNVMNACLCALNFRETGKKIPTWEVVIPNLGLQNATPEEIKVWQEAFGIFLRVPYEARMTGSPDVFQYAVGKVEGGHVYAMRFYRGFDVYGATPE